MDAYEIGVVLAWIVGVARALTGIAFLAAPDRAAESWVGSSTTPARYLVRAVGGRDLAIGGGIIWALLFDGTVGAWVLASVAGDLFDGVSGAAMLSGSHRTSTLAFAGGFGLLGIVTLALLATG